MSCDEYQSIVKKYYLDIKRIAFSYCQNTEDAEDITQIVFVKLLGYQGEFKDELHIKKWLVKVTVNEAKSLWRSFWKRSVVFKLPLKKKESIVSNERIDALKEEIMNLNPRYREIVFLFYYENYSAKDIAEITGDSENVVFKLLQRARDRIRKNMIKRGYTKKDE